MLIRQGRNSFSENENACPAIEADPGLFQVLTGYASRQLDRDLRSARVLDQMFGRAAAMTHSNRREVQ